MSVKDKIINALDVAIDDISEERLVDILLDAYKDKQRQIERLNADISENLERIRHKEDMLLQEQRRMRNDPLYWIAGEYYFEVRERRFAVRVIGGAVQLYERAGLGSTGLYDYNARSLSAAEWGEANK